MRAAYFETTGAPDVIHFGDVPTPVPKAGEVRVKVLAASINPIDTYIRSGAAPMPLPKPAITGTDFAGVVDAVGPGAGRYRVGDRVWGSNQGLLGRQGTCAEFVCVEEKWAYPTPDGVSDEQAAALALVGITAHLGLFIRANLQAGETVFVNGGTGGVGSMVVQMAKVSGARVVTSAGTDEKAVLARELGADAVVNYKAEDFAARVKEAAGASGINVWFETQPPTDLDRTVDLMAPRGRVVVMAGRAARPVLPNGPFYVKGLALLGFAMFNMTPDEQRTCADDMNRWAAAGKLKALIGKTFPLSQTAAAHTLQEDNTARKAGTLTGKIVILPAG
ncbi:quinone oxidoreductase : NADPH2:quinone reductase OS=uncultured planctomycete GN=HGMM_F14B06C16 PE=4 SV=1: ADH_N: ADH_zinc_N [Gemmataceae bacterium]|nr:quinone oxidoreductase : NADPH2:quinone reductase OS=uncultured planctomycete GN=HGMM_F14B06C16 PE=4 SV=1: ADH_N: ADH_zinc_N [Gemmataceae bacterium]VTT98413.1 quinone oxidoreductase : NADPH2:quinone reductase OS=uncultured planctomycete GN=HGMM_F14B06C16 PE=4 SV=1: ADH_N: ADH_zinc_N [Gemmataceae bacterium]